MYQLCLLSNWTTCICEYLYSCPILTSWLYNQAYCDTMWVAVCQLCACAQVVEACDVPWWSCTSERGCHPDAEVKCAARRHCYQRRRAPVERCLCSRLWSTLWLLTILMSKLWLARSDAECWWLAAEDVSRACKCFSADGVGLHKHKNAD